MYPGQTKDHLVFTYSLHSLPLPILLFPQAIFCIIEFFVYMYFVSMYLVLFQSFQHMKFYICSTDEFLLFKVGKHNL